MLRNTGRSGKQDSDGVEIVMEVIRRRGKQQTIVDERESRVMRWKTAPADEDWAAGPDGARERDQHRTNEQHGGYQALPLKEPKAVDDSGWLLGGRQRSRWAQAKLGRKVMEQPQSKTTARYPSRPPHPTASTAPSTSASYPNSKAPPSMPPSYP